jgi:hypothetical protein
MSNSIICTEKYRRGTIDNAQVVIETLSMKIGWIILVLGAMHFFNLFILFSLRRKAHQSFAKSA